MPDRSLADMPGHLIRRLNQHSTAVFQDHTKAAGYDITSVQFAALFTLAETPGLDQASLARKIAYDRATIGGVLKRLEQKQLIDRVACTEDRRAFQLSLTPQGTALLEKLGPIVQRVQDDILAALSASEKTQLQMLMKKIVQP